MMKPEQIDSAYRKVWSTVPHAQRLSAFALEIEAEVRRQDEALIRQMMEALETCDESDGYTGLRQFFDDKAVEAAITARPAGCAGPRCRGSD